MKIGVWHDLPSGGGRRAFEDHCQGLTDRGHELVVTYPERDEQPPRLPSSATAVPLPMREHELSPPGHLLPPYAVLERFRALDAHLRRAGRVLNKNAVDVVFANTSRGVRTPDLARHVDAPAVLYLQEPFRWLYEALPTLPWALTHRNRVRHLASVSGWRYQVRRELRAASDYTEILVNSLFSRESILRVFGLDATVCYLGVDVARFQPNHAERENYVVSLGAMIEEKRHSEIVRAVAAVPARVRPRLTCVSNVATGQYAEQVRDLAGRLGVTLDLLTDISDAEVVRTLQNARALLYAPRLEPFGLAPVEAGACGTPVIAVAEGGVRETVIDNANGLLVQHPRDLGPALTALLADDALAARLGKSGRDRAVTLWGLEDAVDRLEQRLRAAARL